MITTKQRAYLRGLGAKLTPIFQIGKNGIEDNFLKQVDDALEAREILKSYLLFHLDRKSTRMNSSNVRTTRMPSSA